MRIRHVANLLILAFLATSTALWGQVELSTTTEAGKKIGFLQFALVLEGTEEAKLEIGKVRVYMENKQKDYDTKRTELEELKRQYVSQELSLNEETKIEMQRTIQENERLLRRMQEDIQADINTRRDALFARLSSKIQIVLNDFAQTNNYGAVLFVDSLQGYFDPSLDVTQEIIRRYNEANPVSSASTP